MASGHIAALGFEVQEGNKLADEKYCLPVIYRDEIPDFNPEELQSIWHFSAGKDKTEISLTVPFDDPTFRKCISTKPTDWAYEKEWRYIDETDGAHPFPGKLVEVTFGLRCSEADREKYIDLARKSFDYPINFYEIVKRPDSNQIEKRTLRGPS